MYDDKTIVTLSPAAMLSRDFLDSIFDIQEPEERARVRSLAEIRAKELGILSQFKKTVKSFNELDQEIAGEYTAANRKRFSSVELDYDSTGRPVTSIDNFLRILEGDPKFSGIRYNLLTYQPEQVRNGIVFPWSDGDDSEMRRYIEKKYNIHSKDKSDDAFRIVLQKNQYHPIRDLIDPMEWDGVERIPTFLHKWTHCEDSPYTREVSRLIFSGGINRLYRPGCKFDDMPVLIGTQQGEGKSTLVRWLAMADEFFTEVNEFDGQRGMEALDGAWICEVGELLALTKTKDQEAVKSFLTRMNDRRRNPYDRRVSDHKRQCIFIGTTNKMQFLTDKTGNRRFYPVVVHQTGYELFQNEAECKADIAMCWAEAKAKLDEGKMLPFADRNLIEVIRERQAEATEDDYRVGMIQGYLEDKTAVCVPELWQHALGMGEFSKPSKKDSIEIGLIMQSMSNWTKQSNVRRFGAYGPQRWWKNECASDDYDDLL